MNLHFLSQPVHVAAYFNLERECRIAQSLTFPLINRLLAIIFTASLVFLLTSCATLGPYASAARAIERSRTTNLKVVRSAVYCFYKDHSKTCWSSAVSKALWTCVRSLQTASNMLTPVNTAVEELDACMEKNGWNSGPMLGTWVGGEPE